MLFSLVERGFLVFKPTAEIGDDSHNFHIVSEYILYEEIKNEIPKLPFRHLLFATKNAFLL